MFQVFVRRVERMIDLERTAAFAEIARKESVATRINRKHCRIARARAPPQNESLPTQVRESTCNPGCATNLAKYSGRGPGRRRCITLNAKSAVTASSAQHTAS